MRELFMSALGATLSYETSPETSMVKSYAQKTCMGVLGFCLAGGVYLWNISI